MHTETLLRPYTHAPAFPVALEDHPYNSSRYAHAFGEGYEPIYLPQLKIFVLKRAIPGTDYCDAMGCYPLSPLQDMEEADEAFALLARHGIVSLMLVTGPFFCPSHATLLRHFDHVVHNKEHCIRVFGEPFTESPRHRYEIRRARRAVEIRRIALADYLVEWRQLYATLTVRHAITGVQAFSTGYFAALCALEPVMFGAFMDNRLVCAQLWLEFEGLVYNHLLASNEEGYRLRAANAVQEAGLEHFSRNGAHSATLGSGAGLISAASGLYSFKRRFSNATSPGYLCGKIIDKELYAKLSAGKGADYFPNYRG